MRSKKQPPMSKVSADDFQTPTEALNPLILYLKDKRTIWECASGKGNLSSELRKNGFFVIGTDILNGHDFLEWEPDDFDCIVTNPPYSLKEEFIKRCYELGRPFALLLPLTALESEKRQKFWRQGLQLIIPNKRFNFETPSGNGSGSWFASAWFTHGLDLPNDINFVDLK